MGCKTMAEHLIYGKKDGERLVADVREREVSLISYEYVSPVAGLTTLRPRFFCTIPVSRWLEIADMIELANTQKGEAS